MKQNSVDGKTIRALMRAKKVKIRDLAERWQLSLKRIREVRANGVAGAGWVWEWLELIVGATPLYAFLHCQVERHPDLVVAYESDLTLHDRQELTGRAVGDEFVWLAREHGTQLMAAGSLFPVEFTYWIGGEGVIYYHLRVTEVVAGIAFGEVTDLTAAEARSMAEAFAETKAAA